jgi:hypothetical protein
MKRKIIAGVCLGILGAEMFFSLYGGIPGVICKLIGAS